MNIPSREQVREAIEKTSKWDFGFHKNEKLPSMTVARQILTAYAEGRLVKKNIATKMWCPSCQEYIQAEWQ